MYYPEEVIEELRSRNDIVDVISGYIKLQRKGSTYKALCPFHSEKTASFSVSPQRQSYHCFGCGVGGDVFSFVMEYERKTFNEAVETLAERSGMELRKEQEDEKTRQVKSLRKRLLEIHKEAAVYYYRELLSPEGKQAQAYLKSRGLTLSDVQDFGLGYAGKKNGALYALLKSKEYTDAELKASGLFTIDEGGTAMREKFWNRVMFPIMDAGKKVIGFGGRVMGDAKPKYLNSPETVLFDKSANLYGLYAAKTARKKNFILCEGYMDVISLHMNGFKNAVATLGTALTGRQAALIRRYTSEVLLMYDSDEAGVKAALRAIPILREAGVTPKVVNLAPYKDPDELLKAEGRDFLEDRLEKCENGFLFEIRRLSYDYDRSDPEGSSRFQHEAAKKLAEFSDEIERESYLKTVAGMYHIDENMLRREIGRLSMAGYRENAEREAARRAAGQTERRSRQRVAERHRDEEAVLSWVYQKPELAQTVRKYLAPEDFSDGVLRRLAGALLDEKKDTGSVPISVLNGFEEAEERRAASSVLESNALPEGPEEQKKALLEAIVLIKSRKISEAAGQAAPDDMAAFQRIMEEKKKLESLKKQLTGGK